MRPSRIFLRLFLEIKRVFDNRPFIAEFDITDKCNLRCGHCYHFAKMKDQESTEVPLEVWKERFDCLHAEGIRMVMLMGGEPLLRKDVVKLACEMFPFVEMITNGTIELPENHDHRIFVSLDGMRETNDGMRGQGVFDKVLKNVSKDSRVVFNMTLNGHNYKELEQVVELSARSGTAGVVCNLFTTVSPDQETISRELRKNMTDEIRRVKKMYPGNLLFTVPAIDWFEKGDHRDRCYWREKVVHYSTGWQKRPCFAFADCSNCGCFSGAMASPFYSFSHFIATVKLVIETSFLKKRG